MIREPIVSGQFYSSNPNTLRKEIRSFIKTTETQLVVKGAVGPHAGYMYSGAVAGALYGAIQPPNRFIIMGPNHSGRGAHLALYPEGDWRTPLGPASIDKDLNSRLLSECPLLQEDEKAHAREHSIEVHIPFLQSITEEFTFSAICVGTSEFSALEALGQALARVMRESPEPILLVSSSDMTHYESAASSSLKDRLAIERMVAVDPKGLYDVVQEKSITMCGVAPTVALLTACRELDASEGRLVRYANSGDVSGDYDHVVGYAAIVIP
jgi:AmmeMemoRadiSam system protein B